MIKITAESRCKERMGTIAVTIDGVALWFP